VNFIDPTGHCKDLSNKDNKKVISILKNNDIEKYGEDSITYKALLRLENSLNDAYSENAIKTGFSEYSVNAVMDLANEVRRISDKLDNKIEYRESIGVFKLKKYLNYVEMVLYADNKKEARIWMTAGGDANLEASSSFEKENESYDNSNQNAFLHSYWNAQMVKEMGSDSAKKWADAHEFGASNNTGLEKYMDLYNNAEGRKIGEEYVKDKKLFKEPLRKRILKKVQEGEMRRIIDNELVPTDSSSQKKPLLEFK